ncbi:hypothetical protein [Spirosoma validum]|uniref:Uncharacterized protein n=1 Tax=Spirosoma validum TaxID=2771355 RepID=A0A927B4T4_9BACT|nr:hypothetical protein [Spirosoma validum]MBD2755646.1 hypothetical protein [Spirosoma validum]
MTNEKSLNFYSSSLPPIRVGLNPKRNKMTDSFDDEPPKPDWLVLLMSAFFLLTLLIAWLVDIPGLLR